MLSNNKLKYIRSLHQRKFRQKYHNFIAEGEKIAEEVLTNRPDMVEAIFALPEWLASYSNLFQKLKGEVVEISLPELKKISLLNTPNKVLLVVKQPESSIDFDLIKNDFTLYLEDVRDPGNMGTILRIADWFGVKNVLCSPACVEVFNPKVVQSSMGAFLRVNTGTVDFFDLKIRVGGTPIYGAVLGGEPIFSKELSQKSILVIGNESRGISESVEVELTERISIPKHEDGGAESLNAAVATGILCAFFRK